MSNQKALIPEVSQVEFFCDFTDETKQRLTVAVFYVVIDNLRDPEGEESQEIYALAYGYSGGQTQGDWLFGRDSYNSYWKYGDSSGDEWKGAKKIPGVELDAEGNILCYDIETQCRSVFNNVRAIVEESGSCWGKVVDVTVFLTNMKDDFATYNRIYAEYFVENQPCRTTVEIKSLSLNKRRFKENLWSLRKNAWNTMALRPIALTKTLA